MVSSLDVDKLHNLEDNVKALNEKVSDIPAPAEEVKDTNINEFSCYMPNADINALAERMNILEQNIVSNNNASYETAINELKSNYFVLTKTLELLNEKFKDGFGNTNYTTKLDSVVSKVDSLTEVAVKNTDLAAVVEDIVSLKNRVSELEANKEPEENVEKITQLINDVEEINNKLASLEKKSTQISQEIEEDKANNEKSVQETQKEPVAKEEAVSIVEEKKEEASAIEPVNEPQDETVAEVVPNDQDITAKVYDVKILENALHEARNPECKESKPILQSKWGTIEDHCGQSLALIGKFLSSGNLVAVGQKTLIISFPNATICNHLMEPKNHTDAKQVLRVALGKDYDFLALPDITWKEKRMEYHGQYNTGTRFPRLTPIKNPELKVIIPNEENMLSDRQKTLIKAEEFFGKED